MSKLKKLHSLICSTLFTIQPKLDASRLPKAFQLLVKLIEKEPEDSSWYYIGESESATLGDLIVGAYWFYSDYHAGQNSEEYATLSALGNIFSPGRSSLEKDSSEFDVYNALEECFVNN